MFTADQHEEMLAYHSKFDVTILSELLKWQHHVLDKVCGVMSWLTMAKHTLWLSKQMQEELQMVQKLTELSTLSVNVGSGLSHTDTCMKTNSCV